MDPEDVKLSFKEMAVVLFRTIAASIPWKALAKILPIPIIGGIIAAIVSGPIAFFAGAILGFLIDLLVLVLGPLLWEDTKDFFRPIYLEQRTKVAKEAIEKVDDKLLL